MGSIMCPSDHGVHLAAMARDICPFPNYTPNPHFMNMITADSASYLTEHYTVVQRSLSPKQLEDFTQSLKTTFGKEGKVTLGKVGVVALSLAVLFDTLAKQVRGETMSDMGPIPGFFIKEPSGYYPPQVYTMSKCLRLIPHIANNPTRMRQVTESCSTQLIADNNAFKQLRQNNTLPYGEDITAINLMMGNTFEAMSRIYLTQATNTTLHLEDRFERNLQNISAFSLNCDPIAADKLFLAEVENSDNYTKEAFQTCKQFGEFKEKSLMAYMAQLQFEKFIFEPLLAFNLSINYILDLREDFDLKADALGKWT